MVTGFTELPASQDPKAFPTVVSFCAFEGSKITVPAGRLHKIDRSVIFYLTHVRRTDTKVADTHQS